MFLKSGIGILMMLQLTNLNICGATGSHMLRLCVCGWCGLHIDAAYRWPTGHAGGEIPRLGLSLLICWFGQIPLLCLFIWKRGTYHYWLWLITNKLKDQAIIHDYKREERRAKTNRDITSKVSPVAIQNATEVYSLFVLLLGRLSESLGPLCF